MRLIDLVVLLSGYDGVLISLQTEIGYAERFYARVHEIPDKVLECTVWCIKKRGNIFEIAVNKCA